MRRFMSSTAAALAVVAGLTGAANAGLIISELVDGPLSGGNPKFVEITNTGNTDYTFPSGGGLIIQSNDATDTTVDVSLSGVTIAAGASYVIQSSANGGQAIFESTYGFAADKYDSAGFGNGDDRYMITDGTNILDIFGTFGSRAPDDLATYNYLDSYAYRLPNYVDGTGQTYVESQWFRAPVDALDTATASDLLTLTSPGTHTFVPEPATVAVLALGGLLAIRRRK